MAESAQVGQVSPLMGPVLYQGQTYFTSQYFHQQYITNSGYKGKYERHPDFLRLLRSIPAYHLYLSAGDIVELRWTRMKATQKQDLLLWQPMFEEAAYHPITLLNATAQVAMSHHLDDEINQHISVAANTRPLILRVPCIPG